MVSRSSDNERTISSNSDNELTISTEENEIQNINNTDSHGRSDNCLAQGFANLIKLLLAWIYCCSNNEDNNIKQNYKKVIQLESGESKYKKTSTRKQILNTKIINFVQSIRISKKCKIFGNGEVFSNLTDSVKTTPVSAFLDIVLDNERNQNIFQNRDLEILRGIQVEEKDKNVFQKIQKIYTDDIKGRKKIVFRIIYYELH